MKSFTDKKSSHGCGRYNEMLEDKEERLEMSEEKAEELKIRE